MGNPKLFSVYILSLKKIIIPEYACNVNECKIFWSFKQGSRKLTPPYLLLWTKSTIVFSKVSRFHYDPFSDGIFLSQGFETITTISWHGDSPGMFSCKGRRDKVTLAFLDPSILGALGEPLVWREVLKTPKSGASQDCIKKGVCKFLAGLLLFFHQARF